MTFVADSHVNGTGLELAYEMVQTLWQVSSAYYVDSVDYVLIFIVVAHPMFHWAMYYQGARAFPLPLSRKPASFHDRSDRLS